MRLTTERTNAAQVGGRLPGLDAHPNSNVLLDTLTGDDVTVEFGDFLNVAQERPEGMGNAGGNGVSRDGVNHELLQAKYGLY